MRALGALLARFIPGGWVVYLLLATAVAGAGSFAGARIQAALDTPKILRAQAAELDAKKNLAEERAAFDKYHAVIEKDRADADAKALAEQDALQGQIKKLEADLSSAAKARQAASQARLEALKHVTQTDNSVLSDSARDYFRSLRDAQTAPGGGSTPP